MAESEQQRSRDRVAVVEQALVTHWQHFGRYPGAELHDEDGVLWYESPIGRLPYNAVIRSRVPPGVDADAVTARLVEHFRRRAVPFMWVVRPTDTPADLGNRLTVTGLDLVEVVTGMDLDLTAWDPDKPVRGVEVVEVDTDEQLADYEALIRSYWSVPDADRDRIRSLNRYWSGDRSPGLRLVAYADGQPVGKLFLNLLDLPVAAVYGVAVLPEARGRGVASALMSRALVEARARDATEAVLHSSPMAVSLYRRAGFRDVCTLHVYATAPLFGTHHH